jgi:predicted transcriptional regulator
MNKTGKRDAERAARVKKTAIIVGVSEAMVYKVLIGDRNNEEVFNTYMDLLELEREAFETAKENHLLAEVEKIVPFNK